MIQKNFNEERSNEFYLKTYGSQRQYDTNIYEGILINDIFSKVSQTILNMGLYQI